MSNYENKVVPNWANFDEMKAYAKSTANNVVQLELSQNEMYNEYFSTFEHTELVQDCIKLTNAFINYTHNKDLLEQTKLLCNELNLKWTEKIVSASDDNSKNTINNNNTSEIVNIEGNTTESEQLTLFPTEVNEEEKNKIASLKQKMKALKIDYNATLSLEENQKLYDDTKKDCEEAKKNNKKIEDLKAKMSELYLEYDDSITYDENKELYNNAIDKSENPSYTYPFKIYFKGCDIRQLDHIFEQNHQYTTKEICELMFKHNYKEYAGDVKLTYNKDENLFVPDFTSQRHG